MILEAPRVEPDYEMADDMADWAISHPEINRGFPKGLGLPENQVKGDDCEHPN